MIRTAHRRRGLSRSAVRSLLLAGFVFGVAGLAIAGHFTAPSNYGGQPVLAASDQGPAIAIPAGGATANFADFAVDDHTLRVETHGAGNATFVSEGRTSATVDALTGTWANLSAVDLQGRELFVDADGRPAINVSGDLETVAWNNRIRPDDGHADVVYGGPNGSTSVTVHGLEPGQTYYAWDRVTESVLDTAHADIDGAVTFSHMPNSNHVIMVHTHPDGTDDSDLLGNINVAHAILLILLVSLLAVMAFTIWSKIAMFGLVISGLMVGMLMVGLVPADLAVLIVVACVVLVGSVGIWAWGGI